MQERRIHFQSSDQFSNLQLVCFQRYTRLYPVNTMFFVCFACFIDRFVNFRQVSLSFSKVTSQCKKEEYISSLVTNFKISSWFVFRDIHVCILSIRCFLCVLHVLLTDSSIFARFHWVSVKWHSKTRKKNTFQV